MISGKNFFLRRPPISDNVSYLASHPPASTIEVHGYDRRIFPPPKSERCRVPLCRNPKCSLRSHRLYGTSVQPVGHRDTISEPYNHTKMIKQEASLPLRSKPISGAGIDALPTLPIEGKDSVALRPLFHYFFDVVFDRLAALFRGPAVVTEEHKKRMLPIALSNPTYCIGLVLQSHTDIVGSRKVFEETKESAYLYGKLMKAFRHEIAKLSHGFDAHLIEIALLDICILLAYDLLYDRREFLWHHWIGLQRLVEFRGGIEAVTTALPYVVHVDRSCAVAFSRRAALVRKRELINEPQSTGANYGAKFALINNDVQFLLSADVLTFCKDTAKLLRTWEQVHRADPQSPGRTSAIYLHNCRDRIDEQFTIMHAEMMRMPLMDQCCVLAARIVEYPITWANYYPLNNEKHCAHLCQILRSVKPTVNIDWRAEVAQDLLRWMLFSILVSSTKSTADRIWTLKNLRNLVQQKYGFSEWSSVTARRARSLEKMNLYGFIWCHSALNKIYDHVWIELENLG